MIVVLTLLLAVLIIQFVKPYRYSFFTGLFLTFAVVTFSVLLSETVVKYVNWN